MKNIIEIIGGRQDWLDRLVRKVRMDDAARGRYMGSRMTHDSPAFQYRMGAGFLGDVNRTHPADILPCLIDANAPPTVYGTPVVVDPTTQGVRPLVAGDSGLTAIYGVTVRPYPQQASSGNAYGGAPFGSATPPATGVIDILLSGFIMIPVYGASVKGGTVYIWVAANSGNHVQNTFEIVGGGGSNTIALDAKSSFNGSPDTSAVLNASINVTELAFNV